MAQSRFAELFEQSTDIYDAIHTVMRQHADDGEAIDPIEIVDEVLNARPDISMSPAEILEMVVNSAAQVGVSLKVNTPDRDT
jgi:hypothetical protein